MSNCTGVCVPASLGPEWTPIVSLVASILLAAWMYLLKLPAVQRTLGAENTDKREKLDAIHEACVTPAPAPPSESTPIVPKT
jgi:hypothetical protein